MADQEAGQAPAPLAPDSGERESTSELVMMLGVLLFLVVVAAIVFLVIPPSWIGARVEIIFHQ